VRKKFTTTTHLFPCVSCCLCPSLHLLHHHIQLSSSSIATDNHRALSTSLQLTLAACGAECLNKPAAAAAAAAAATAQTNDCSA
jgi:hypothetical protein